MINLGTTDRQTVNYYSTIHALELTESPWSTQYQGQYFETRISSSKSVSLGFQDSRASFKDWAYRGGGGGGGGGSFWYLVKELRYLLLKRQNDKKTGRVSALFLLYASPSLLSIKFLLNRSNCAKGTDKS